MHDSRGARLKVGDRVLIEAEVTELQEGADPNYCNVHVKVVTPQQRDTTPMVPPGVTINTKMLTKVGPPTGIDAFGTTVPAPEGAEAPPDANV